MNTKQQISSYFSFLNSRRAGLLNLLAMLLLSACATPPPYITFSEPKVYSDDQVATALGDQYRKLQDAASKITGKDLQEVFVIKQATQLDANIAASPAGTAPVTAPGKIASDKIELEKLTMPASSDVGLSYAASLRKKMNDEWEVLGRSLFLSGDQTLKDAGNVVLVRFDVSINNYIPADTFGDTQRFAYIRFTVCETGTGIEKCPAPEGLKIYALEPEFNSTVGKEELITSALEDYQGEVGGTTEGVNLQGALRYQRALYEGFQRLVEQPLQFSVYGYYKNEFGCALGPMRQIVKRSWINPARIFGNKYRIDHIIEPGARQCYALVILPKKYDGKRLDVKADYYRRDFLNNGDIFPANGPSGEQKECGKTIDCGLYQKIGLAADISYRQLLWGNSWSAKTDYYIKVPKADNGMPLADHSVSIFPKTTSTVMVSTPFPLSPDSRVLIGPAAVEPYNVEILGRTLLKVTVPPNETLQALLAKNEVNQKMVILTPGCSPDCTQQPITATLKDSVEKQKTSTETKP